MLAWGVVELAAPDDRPVGEVKPSRGLLVLLARRAVFGLGVADRESVGCGAARRYWILEK